MSKIYSYDTFEDDLIEALELDELSDSTEWMEDLIEGMKSNMYCDYTGICEGAACPNFFRCI